MPFAADGWPGPHLPGCWRSCAQASRTARRRSDRSRSKTTLEHRHRPCARLPTLAPTHTGTETGQFVLTSTGCTWRESRPRPTASLPLLLGRRRRTQPRSAAPAGGRSRAGVEPFRRSTCGKQLCPRLLNAGSRAAVVIRDFRTVRLGRGAAAVGGARSPLCDAANSPVRAMCNVEEKRREAVVRCGRDRRTRPMIRFYLLSPSSPRGVPSPVTSS